MCRDQKFGLPVLGRHDERAGRSDAAFSHLAVWPPAGLEAPTPACWRGEAVNAPANRTPPPAEMENYTQIAMDDYAQVKCSKAAGGAPSTSRHIRCRTPPLHTLPIDPSRWPLLGNLLSPCSPRFRGAMHMPTPRSVRSSSLARPLLTSPRVLCTLARSLSWRGALRLSLWHAALRHTASLNIQLCQGHGRAAPARAGVRCRLALRPGVLAVCTVAVSAVAHAASGLSFSPPFEPEALSRCMWCRGGEI